MKKNQREPSSRERLRKLSVVIPARNEQDCIASAVEHLHLELRLNGIDHEIIVVDDGSTDKTWHVLATTSTRVPTLTPVQNTGPNGFGRAVTLGFDHISGDAVVIMMADESDDCRDVVAYWRVLNDGWDAVFGSRFIRGGGAIDYPVHKLILNRAANLFLRILFHSGKSRVYNLQKERSQAKLRKPSSTWSVVSRSWKGNKKGAHKAPSGLVAGPGFEPGTSRL